MSALDACDDHSAPLSPQPSVTAPAVPAAPAAPAAPAVGRHRTLLRALRHCDLEALRGIARYRLAILRARWRLRHCSFLGRHVRLHGRMVVEGGGKIRIADRVLFHMHVIPGWLVARPGALIEIGSNTFINQGCWISAHQHVRIGADCFIGPYCTILDNPYHTMGNMRRLPPSRPVIIGDRVWIAAHVSILPGVTVGNDAVIGIGAVVTKDVPPRTLVVGNPARCVGTF